MEKEKKRKLNISRYTLGNLFIIAGILIITTLEWHFYDMYQAFTRYGTLITFVALAGAFLCYVDIKDTIKDKLFWLMVVTDLVALINLILLGSNKGSLLIVVDFMLILYLSDKVAFSIKESYFVLIYIAFFFFYWTIDVKGYFKGYNTNYGGLILITGFACVMIIMQVLSENMQGKYYRYIGEFGDIEGKKTWWKRNWWYPPLCIFLVILSFNIISWYRSRTALMGLIALLVIILLPEKIVRNKVIYPLICFFSTFGAILLATLYIGFSRIFGAKGNITLFYKDIVSGRNEIWTELFNAFLEKPLTGIGSSYTMKLDFMEGMLEAHSAMLDILVVHGIIVFIPLCALLTYRIYKLKEKSCVGNVDKAVFAAIICVMVTGFFENYYIVQPFSLILLCLLAINPMNIRD